MRKTKRHIAIRLPNWLGDICMALPLISSMQKKAKTNNTEDIIFTIFAPKPYTAMLGKLGIEGTVIGLPDKNWRYFFSFLKYRKKFDTFILFTNSERGDIEAWLTRTPVRYGIARHQKPRKLLTDRYSLDEHFDEHALHQTTLWAQFLQSTKLIENVTFSPLKQRQELKRSNNVALICGSANTPQKRWPITHWQELTTKLLKHFDTVTLVGTAEDRDICEKIHKEIKDPARVYNCAGQTNLCELIDILETMQLVIGNDTGGLHLANSIGVPVIGLCGVTNAIRCRPIFSAPTIILESPHGFRKGAMTDISIDSVLNAALSAVGP